MMSVMMIAVIMTAAMPPTQEGNGVPAACVCASSIHMPARKKNHGRSVSGAAGA